MSSTVPELWEIWHARFDFSEGKGYKYRPVIVVGVHPDGSLVMMVTSATNKLTLEHDTPIADWKSAGLDKPSIARADRIAQIPAGYLGNVGRIGKLSERGVATLSMVLRAISNPNNKDSTFENRFGNDLRRNVILLSHSAQYVRQTTRQTLSNERDIDSTSW